MCCRSIKRQSIGIFIAARRSASSAWPACHAGYLEHHPPRLDDGNPVLRVALAGTHPRLGRLLRHRLVREDANPDLAAALQVVGDRAPGGLDLAAADPCRLRRLQRELAKGDLDPRCALPVMRPRIILRYLVRFGINMIDAPACERSSPGMVPAANLASHP